MIRIAVPISLLSPALEYKKYSCQSLKEVISWAMLVVSDLHLKVEPNIAKVDTSLKLWLLP